jgi:deazaflavin-dependent oxidoreductase (nitroreductase family)
LSPVWEEKALHRGGRVEILAAVALLPDSFYTRISTSSATALRWTGKLNIPLYRVSGGRIGGKVGDAPVLLLTTTGRKSGQRRTAPVLYMRYEETTDGNGQNDRRLVVIGSNAGHSNEPAWSLNLKANPEAEVEVGRSRTPVRARIADDEERADLWRKINEVFSGFDTYETRTDRDIAVFVLDPR